ncbi:MAG: hypothetical protein KI790_04485 [Cyclobacteriaceae bacterium]|nr:hypothetical protein [Cyclobacteriaceae bacterium HetDA_MAG_MS6]
MKQATLLLAILTIVVSTASANGGKESKKNSDGKSRIENLEEIYRLVNSLTEEGFVKVNIKNNQGKVIQRGIIKNKDGFVKSYNLDMLEDDAFMMEITNGKDVVYKTVDEDLLAIRTLGNRRYRVIVAQEAAADYSILIYNKKDLLVHQEKHEDSDGLARVFDLSGISGNVTFEIRDADRRRQIAVR